MHPLLRRLGLSAVVAALLLTFVSLPAPRAHAAEILLSQGRPVAASSTEEPFSVQGAVDGTPRPEAAYGKAFHIEVSNDAQAWSTVHETAQGTGGTGYGYSLWEFQVYGTGGPGGGGGDTLLSYGKTGAAAPGSSTTRTT
ncbi:MULTISPECIES: hypothetical protein [Streptomyces]|uniref:F5/8 type C domain-containing protein n=2 Tax=Streptomyces TaxID=1883 RepID=A0A2U9NVC7_STRAS|nr:hypothetical protein [Streptomyces actuosus]AWT40981.1 hypothetical protein DMT42_00575 [Streptomyces actuosus]MBM4826535.1 hypothetical protein [Streptomyces actuosus]